MAAKNVAPIDMNSDAEPKTLPLKQMAAKKLDPPLDMESEAEPETAPIVMTLEEAKAHMLRSVQYVCAQKY